MLPERIIGRLKPRDAMQIFVGFIWFFVCLQIFVVVWLGGFVYLVGVLGALGEGFLSQWEQYTF